MDCICIASVSITSWKIGSDVKVMLRCSVFCCVSFLCSSTVRVPYRTVKFRYKYRYAADYLMWVCGTGFVLFVCLCTCSSTSWCTTVAGTRTGSTVVYTLPKCACVLIAGVCTSAPFSNNCAVWARQQHHPPERLTLDTTTVPFVQLPPACHRNREWQRPQN